MSSDESGFVGLKLFFRVHVVRVLFHLMSFSFLTEVNALLEVVLHDVHLGDDSLNTNELIGHFATEPSRSDKIGAQVALKTDLVMLHFPVKARSLVSELGSLEMVFGDTIILLRIFDEILGSLRVLLSELVDINLDSESVSYGHPHDEVIEESFVILYLHLAHYKSIMKIKLQFTLYPCLQTMSRSINKPA